MKQRALQSKTCHTTNTGSNEILDQAIGGMRGLGGLEHLKLAARCLPSPSWLLVSNRDFLQRVKDWNDDKQIVASMEEDRSYQSAVLKHRMGADKA